MSPSSDNRNQCDGCARGLELRGDIHVTAKGLAVQACTKALYDSFYCEGGNFRAYLRCHRQCADCKKLEHE